MFVEVLEVQISVAFEFYLDEEFCDMISCLRFQMPPFFVECPPYNSGAFLLAGNAVVGSWAFGESNLYVEELYILIWSIIFSSIYVSLLLLFLLLL